MKLPIKSKPGITIDEKDTSQSLDMVDESETSPAPVAATPKKPSRKKVLLVVAALVLVAAVAAGLYLQRKPATPTKVNSVTQESVAAELKDGSVFCVKVGISSLQCENLDTKDLRKFTIPENLGEVSGMTANPNGSRYLISAWSRTGSTSTEVQSVYDAQLKRLSILPELHNSDGSVYTYTRIYWLDSKTLVYLKPDNNLYTKSVIGLYDTDAGKEKASIELNGNIERMMPSGNPRYVYAIQAQVDTKQNATVRKLVVIDLQTKAIINVDNTLVDVNHQDITYNQSTGRFYANILLQQEQKFNVGIYKNNDLTGKPKLVSIGEIKDVYAQGTTAYEVIATEKGIFGTADMLQWKAPLKLYAEDGHATELSLAVGSYGGTIALSLPNFPDFPKADTNETVVGDFFNPASGTPKKITTFVEGLVEKNEGCGKGEYTSFTIGKYDEDKQFSLSKAGCDGAAGIMFYKVSGDTYVQFASTREGMACSERDRLGISAVIFPDCRKPGEGL